MSAILYYQGVLHALKLTLVLYATIFLNNTRVMNISINRVDGVKSCNMEENMESRSKFQSVIRYLTLFNYF